MRHSYNVSIRAFVLLSLLLLGSFLRAEEITLVADEWCPYNCQPGSDYKGFMVDIAEHIFHSNNIRVNYQVIPWARAILEVRKGHYQGIIGAGRTEVPDFIFPDKALGKAEHTFYVPENSSLSWEYEGLKSLHSIKLGVIRGYSYGNLHKSYIVKNRTNPERIEIVHGESGLQQNIDKLMIGRIDMLIEDRAVFNTYLALHKIPNTFISRGVAFTEEVFIAFSPALANSKKYAKMLTQGMQELRSSGALQILLKKYGEQDWEASDQSGAE